MAADRLANFFFLLKESKEAMGRLTAVRGPAVHF